MQVPMFLFLSCFLRLSFAATPTQLHLFRPMTETPHQPNVTIKDIKAGECTEQSRRISREDAWRCVVNEAIFDPCFVNPFGDRLTAICIDSPWSIKATQINVSYLLDNHNHATLDMSRALPFALELTNHEKCLRVESKEILDGLPVNYHCDSGSLLIGPVLRCQSEWTVLQAKKEGVSSSRIIRAWF